MVDSPSRARKQRLLQWRRQAQLNQAANLRGKRPKAVAARREACLTQLDRAQHDRADLVGDTRGEQQVKILGGLAKQRRQRGLNDAFDRALRDDSVKVIILVADGRNFSTGHDIADTVEHYQEAMQDSSPRVSTWSGFNQPGAHGWYASEKEGYLESARRIRNNSKPTICAVQGKCIAGALIYAWVCGTIIAADNALFSEPVVDFGVSGVEWLAHPWELGHRKAREFLFTADAWNAEEAHRLGMVKHVVPLDELEAFTLAMAQKIAAKPAFALKLARDAINKTLDIQGQMNAIDQAFSLHHLCHQQNFRVFGYGMDTSNLPSMASAPKKAE